jgi:hypothetical protein
MRKKGEKTKKNNREFNREVIIALNNEVFHKCISDDDLKRLYELTKHKNYENVDLYIKEIRGDKHNYIYKSTNSYKYKKEYIDENNNILTREYIIEFYLGGKEKSNFREQIYRFGIKPYSRVWDENRNIIEKEKDRKSIDNIKNYRNELIRKRKENVKFRDEQKIIDRIREAEYDECINMGYDWKYKNAMVEAQFLELKKICT